MSREYDFQMTTLDKIDFAKYFKEHEGVRFEDLISIIEKDYDNTDLSNNDILCGFIFNWIGYEELIEYLESRYEGRLWIYEHAYHTFKFQQDERP